MASSAPFNPPSSVPPVPPQSPELPSPYAQRFGIAAKYPFITNKSSGLHPRFPDRDLDDRQPIPHDAAPIPRPRDDEIDLLFLEEDYQAGQFQSLTTWQVQNLNDAVPAKNCNLQLEEKDWEPAFQKARFYNVDKPLREGFSGELIPELSETDTWTVDNPVLWDALKPSLQVANSLFRASLADPFYHAVTTMTKATNKWEGQTPWNLRQDPYLATFPRKPTDDEVTKLRELFAGYAERVIISFFPPGCVGASPLAFGITTAFRELPGLQSPYQFVLILMNPGFVWPLLDTTTSPTEKALARFSFSKTLAHEMAVSLTPIEISILCDSSISCAKLGIDKHAMFRVHWRFTNSIGGVLNHEPFYQLGSYQQWINEIGCAWESAILGGRVVSYPNPKMPSLRRQWNARILMVTMEDFPNYKYMTQQGIGVNREDHGDDKWSQYFVPLSHTSGYFTTEFWEVRYRAFGLQALKIPHVLRQERGVLKTSISKLQRCKRKYFSKDTAPELNQVRAEITNCNNTWIRLRPWFVDAYTEWCVSIHSYTEIRSGNIEFQDSYLQRDEIAAESALRQFSLQGFNRWRSLILSRDGVAWFVDAVGYLMLAIMPRRDNNDTTSRLCVPENCWSPSLEAVRLAESQNRAPWVIDSVGAQKYGTLETKVTKRHVPLEGGQNGVGDRKTFLEKLKIEATIRELNSVVPPDIVEAFWVTFKQAEADARVTDDKDWLPNFNLKIRGWRSKTNEGHTGAASASRVAGYNGPEPMQYTAEEAAAQPSGQGDQPGSSAGSAMSARRASPDQPRQSKYYTIGEVGNHRFRTDLWALVDDGKSGLDVYDVTDAVEETRARGDRFDITTMLKKTLLGLEAQPEFQRELRESHEPIGKLIRPLRREEIAERNGEHGKPLWIILGQNVFDITELPIADNTYRRMIRSNPGGNPMAAIDMNNNVAPNQVLDGLWPYRCATLSEPRPASGPPESSENLYTAAEVAWYTYRETRMYTIIGKNVYDMTNFVDSHPGGSKLIEQWAGKDATDVFHRYHAYAERCLADYDFLRIGRVIREDRLPIADNQILIHGMVYDLRPVDSWMVYGWKEIQEGTQSLRGTDASDKVMADKVAEIPEVLLDLISRRELIVAKIPPPLHEVTHEELASNDGTVIPIPQASNEVALLPPLRSPVWICHGRDVYDVTALWKYGEDDMRAAIDRFKGELFPTGQISARLQREFSHRVIGVLVNRKRPREEVTGDDQGGGGDDGLSSKLQRIELASGDDDESQMV